MMVYKKNSIGCQSESKLRYRWKRVDIALTALLTLCIFVSAVWGSSILTVRAATNSETTLAVFKGQSQTAEPFSADSVFPGDRTQKEYNVQVSYTGDITLHFHADIRPGYEKLAEVLKCRILVEGKEVYDGLMRDMPAKLDHNLSSSKRTTETVSYDIAVYLDTSVGNDYQGKQLICDFRWWVDVSDSSSGELTEPPKTGDVIMTSIVMLVLSGSVLILLLAKRKKEEDRHAGK